MFDKDDKKLLILQLQFINTINVNFGIRLYVDHHNVITKRSRKIFSRKDENWIIEWTLGLQLITMARRKGFKGALMKKSIKLSRLHQLMET